MHASVHASWVCVCAHACLRVLAPAARAGMPVCAEPAPGAHACSLACLPLCLCAAASESSTMTEKVQAQYGFGFMFTEPVVSRIRTVPHFQVEAASSESALRSSYDAAMASGEENSSPIARVRSLLRAHSLNDINLAGRLSNHSPQHHHGGSGHRCDQRGRGGCDPRGRSTRRRFHHRGDAHDQAHPWSVKCELMRPRLGTNLTPPFHHHPQGRRAR